MRPTDWTKAGWAKRNDYDLSGEVDSDEVVLLTDENGNQLIILGPNYEAQTDWVKQE